MGIVLRSGVVRFAVALALAAALGAPPAAQRVDQSAQPPASSGQQTQTPERAQQPIRTGINFVRVDVIVTSRNGEPLLDLKPEEFGITENGKPQKIDSFQVIKIDQSSAVSEPLPRDIRSPLEERREASRPDVRLFIILLDDYHVRRGNDMAVRKPLVDFIQNQLAPADMVAIMYPLTPVSDLTFTRNRDTLASAIEKFEGRRFNYTPRNDFEDRYAHYPAAQVERIRNDVTMSALQGAAVKLGGMREGRKSIIFVSEGFTSILPPQLNDPIASMPGLGNPARGRQDVQVDERAEFMAEASMMSDLQEVFREASRNNTSIYPVDPRGLAAAEYDIDKGVGMQVDRRHLQASLDTLRVLAANTDGKAIVNRNDLASGLKQIIRDSSGYYLIGYNSTEAPTDGKFHEIKVRVTRKGVEVRARKGYWAYSAEDAARATAPPKADPPTAVSSALKDLAEPARRRSARFWIGTARGENGRTAVTFYWEPAADTPGDRPAQTAKPARVSLTALAPDGRPLFRGRVPEDTAAATEADGSASQGTAPLGAKATFEAEPGQLQLKIIVESADGQILDSASRELTVPDFTTVQVSLSTPIVFRARTPRELQAIRSGKDVLPSADRQFTRTDRALLRVFAYAPGNTSPAVSARLLNRNGDAMAPLEVQAGASGAVDVEMPLGNLAPGDYLIELTAKSESGTVTQLVAFQVGR